MKKAIVVGSTGLVGHELTELLLADSIYSEVITLVRKQSGRKHHKLREVVVEFDHLEKVKDQIKADEAFCCLGTTMKKAGSKEAFEKVDLIYPINFAKYFHANGGNEFTIISAMGADEQSMFYYNQIKGRVERELEQMKFEVLNIVRPSLLIGERKEKRAGEGIGAFIFSLIDWMFIGAMKRYKSIKATTVAKAMVRIQENNTEGINIYTSDKLQVLGTP